MKYALVTVMILAVTLFASVRVGGTGQSGHVPSRGSYTVDRMMTGGLSASYGLAIKTTVANSFWILNWSDAANYEFELDTGNATGNSWAITGGVDADDQAFCEEYTGGAQWFMTDYASSMFAVFEEDGTFIQNINGPAGYTNLFGIGAGHDNIYVGSPNEDKLAWGSYTGTESSITWSEVSYDAKAIYGLAVWEDYLFVSTDDEADVNLLIHSINPDGSPDTTPVWTAIFFEVPVNGGIDYDGEFLYIYPQNDFVYVLDIDFEPSALEQTTWGDIKAGF